jgi:phosphatidylserine/phosphatidylglycerophosphate/cardiolipin synthase-like enzyme
MNYDQGERKELQKAVFRFLVLSLVGFLIYSLALHRGSSWSVYFSPQGGCTEAIIKELDGAKKEILIQSYSFQSAPLVKALLNARNRGVKVKVILDKRQKLEKNSSTDFLAHSGIPTMTDGAHAMARNKVVIIDGETVITGSFDFTPAAEDKNAENLLVIRDRELLGRYTQNFWEHEVHSEPYSGK